MTNDFDHPPYVEQHVIGKCSKCGGKVVRPPSTQHRSPPDFTPYCTSCGATKAPPNRIIPMV